ncbi:MAG: response regulator transcription factor [Anaerolineales bacterium]|jgi:DNA-binding NarL/FixJ family response regulator
MIRVLLVDDHPVVRLGIRKLIEKEADIEVVGEAENGKEALAKVGELSPDVILLDMEMPEMTGNQVAYHLQEQGASVRILALSAYDDKQYIQELLKNGASGYLIKEEVAESIVEAVRGVARGEQGWVSRSVAERLSSLLQEDESPQSELTPRELEVLQELVTGKTNQEIGLSMGVSEKTVEKHLRRIFEKMGVVSRVDAAVRALREGWIETEGG